LFGMGRHVLVDSSAEKSKATQGCHKQRHRQKE
jgi:hypothetical protein